LVVAGNYGERLRTGSEWREAGGSNQDQTKTESLSAAQYIGTKPHDVLPQLRW
jgi:hypothetical protein